MDVIPGGTTPAQGQAIRRLADEAVDATISAMKKDGWELLYKGKKLSANGIDLLFKKATGEIAHVEAKYRARPRGRPKSYLRGYQTGFRQCSGKWTKNHIQQLLDKNLISEADTRLVLDQLKKGPENREFLQEYVAVWTDSIKGGPRGLEGVALGFAGVDDDIYVMAGTDKNLGFWAY